MRVLNVAEKPSVAKEIAQILSNGGYKRTAGYSQYNALYDFPYEINGVPVHMVVTSVTGHLMVMDFDARYRSWQSCDPSELFTAPVFKRVRSDGSQQKIERTLKQQAQQCQWLVLWLDCDREGENIAFEVKAVCEQAVRNQSSFRVFRARFSALIPQDIIHAVQNLSEPDKRLSSACDARMEIDLRIGAAFTRFQTVRIQKKFPSLKRDGEVISYGPCQFPTLGFIVERYLQIQNFEREDFFYISVTHTRPDLPDAPITKFSWRRERLYDRFACMCIYEAILNRKATVVNVTRRPTSKLKPLPLTTVELQKCASRFLRISSEQTMATAEKLYNKGYISYPRTETNKFKEGTDLMGLIRLHEFHHQWGSYVTDELLSQGKFENPRNGSGDDQAHPPIHPTKCVDLGSINDPIEKKVYEFVTLHFLACCSRDAKGDQTNVLMKILHEQFTATGLMVTERNYLRIYKYDKWSTSTIPVYQTGEVFEPTAISMVSGETSPPPLLSEADLIAKMDTHGIGTDATIAEHIKTVQNRKYAVKVNNNTQFQPTTLGLALVQSYEHMGLELAKPVLRAAMENDCKAIARGIKDVKDVVESCMEQMRTIFNSVTRNASVLDATFSEHFGHAITTLVDASDGIGTTTQYVQEVHLRGQRTHNAREDSMSNTSFHAGADSVCCNHNELCIKRTVRKEGKNRGRTFWACNRNQGESCGYFEWTTETSQSSAEELPHSLPQPSVPLCGHDRPCVVRTSHRAGANHGREFFVCANSMKESCGFFAWRDNDVSTSTHFHESESKSSITGEVPVCECGSRCITLQCRSGSNKGRSFYKCHGKDQENQCSFFKWA